MSDVTTFKEAATVLQEVDVSKIFTSLALGIAEAQEKLDDNSVKQIIRLSGQMIGTKSLLELGFIPSFYSFQYADIQASIQLKMAVSTKTSLELKAKFDYAKEKGYSSEDLNLLEDSQSNKERKEYKSSRDILMRASSSETITVQNKTFSMNQQEGSITKVENFTNEIHSAENVSRVDLDITESSFKNNTTIDNMYMRSVGGYLSIFIENPVATSDKGILMINSYPTAIATDFFTLKTSGTAKKFDHDLNFLETIKKARVAIDTAGKVIGFSKDSFYSFDTGVAIPKSAKMEMYFAHNRYRFDTAYNEASPSDSLTYSNVKTTEQLEFLSFVLKNDPSAKIEITGHTDNTGDETKNQSLGKRRAQEVKNKLISLGVLDNQMTTNSKGETEHTATPDIKDVKYRKVSIKIAGTPDYIYFEGGDFKAASCDPKKSTTATTNCFTYWKASGGASTAPYTIKFNHFDKEYTFTGISSVTDINVNNLSVKDSKYSLEVVNNTAYLLHSEAKLHFTAYSSNSEEINITSNKSTNSEVKESESTVYIKETDNKKNRIIKDSEKIENPSTLAIGASVDLRTSRQFDMDLSGNASMSARLVSVPPPDGFKSNLIEALKN
jgi:OmpA family